VKSACVGVLSIRDAEYLWGTRKTVVKARKTGWITLRLGWLWLFVIGGALTTELVTIRYVNTVVGPNRIRICWM